MLKVPATNKIEQNSLQAWILASRPKTLTGAAVPVVLGCALAWSDGGFSTALQTISTAGPATDAATTANIESLAETAATVPASLLFSFILPAALCFAFAFLMQIDANFINDLWDFRKGSDRKDRLGPERACAQGWIPPQAMRTGIILTTIAACVTGCGLLFFGGWWLIAVGAACVLFAFLYTAGPYPLAYHGWGDLLVLIFFGLVPVGCTYYVLCGGWNGRVAVVATACGLVIDTLLLINNYRDREQDARSGKRTLVVRLGAKAGERLYLSLGIAATGLCLLLLRAGDIWAAILPLGYLIPHTVTWRQMVQINHGRELNRILGKTSRNILLFGILLALGLL